jgi:hypothetical protein
MLTPRIMSISDRIINAVGVLEDGEFVVCVITDEYDSANLRIMGGGALLYEGSDDAYLHRDTGDFEETILSPDPGGNDSASFPGNPSPDG